MDLIYADANNVDIGILHDYQLDLAFGEDENNFELTMPLIAHCLDKDYTIYIEGTEYGGIIDGYQVNTELRKIVYKGRTWHGIFNSKVITPLSGNDYYIVSGEANSILDEIITYCGLSDLFTASTDTSEVVLPSTKIDRYKSAYEALLKTFRNAGGKLTFSYSDGVCTVGCVPLVDYSQSEEFNSDQLSFTIEKNFNAVNHLICLGSGQLSARQRIDLYADADGNISNTQTFTGLDEITEVYDYSSVESLEELEKEGKAELKSRRDDGKIDVKLTHTQDFDISDIIGATEETTGLTVTKHISKKIVTIEKDRLKVDYNING